MAQFTHKQRVAAQPAMGDHVLTGVVLTRGFARDNHGRYSLAPIEGYYVVNFDGGGSLRVHERQLRAL